MVTKKEKVNHIVEILEELYPVVKPPLNHSSHYTLLVAVLLSAQCTDKRVNIVTPKLFKKAKNAREMLKLSIDEIQEIIRPCGLSKQKATAIYNLSDILHSNYNGRVPKTLEELTELPGVGRKTAQVVLAQAFNIPSFPVDTHIHRLAKRWKLSNGKSVTQTERDLRKCFPEKLWNKLHLQIIFYGREYCMARGHEKDNCKICTLYG